MAEPVKYFIFDLDGLILDTESLCIEVAEQVLQRYGKAVTPEVHRVALGKRPLDCWTDVARVLGLEVEPQQLLDESEALLVGRWPDARLLPGAMRLLSHLHTLGVPIAVGTSTPRSTFIKKMSLKPELQAMFKVVVCGDEVKQGKPHPDVFLEAARQLGAPPSQCLVLEDAPSGVEAAIAAGMRVVVVPSLVGSDAYPAADAACACGVTHILPSLLAFDPVAFALPSFADQIHGVIPVEPVYRIKGTVVKGFGRGSKELGIPTANIDSTALNTTLAEAVTGIYAGWAQVGGADQPVHKMVMSIGWNPFYDNKVKTAEPWILHNFDAPFYGQDIRLLICAYLRPEANFTSLQALIDQIHADARMAEVALDHDKLSVYREELVMVAAE